MFDIQHFRRSGGVKRPEWETFLGHSDVPCGPDIVLSSISLCSWNNGLFILEYPIVLAAIKLVNRSLKRFDISHLGGVKRNVVVHSRIFLFYYFFRLNRTLLHPCWFYKSVWRSLACSTPSYAHLHHQLLLSLVEIPLQC